MRYLVLLSLLLVVLSTSPANALETPPNVLWRHNITVDNTTTTQMTDCQVLGNGNVAFVGLYGGTGPLLGAAFDPAKDPTNGTFVALQSPAGELLWLHRFAGVNYPKLSIDAADNITLMNCAIESVSVLGSTLPAEPTGRLLYRLSFKADGTLNHLQRIGRIEGSVNIARSSCQLLTDGCLIALEFVGTLEIAENTYTCPDNKIGVILLKLQENGTPAWDHQFYSSYSSLGESLPLPDGGQLYWVGLTGSGTFGGQTYDAPANIPHSLLIWLDAAGTVTRTARVRGPNFAFVTGVLRDTDGDLILQLSGRGNARIEPQTGTPLIVTMADATINIALARVSGDFSELRWQKHSETFDPQSRNPLCRDQAGNIYAAFDTLPLFVSFDGTLFKNGYLDDVRATSLLKLDRDGNVLWHCFEKSPWAVAFAVSPEGRSYLATVPYIYTTNSLTISIASSWETSPPAFTLFSLTNQLATAGSTLKFLTTVSAIEGTVYYWTKDSLPFTNSSVSTLTISNVTAADAGLYSFTASNQFGSISAGPFTFTLAPASRLAASETLKQVDSASVDYLHASFSPSGRHQLYTFSAGDLITDSAITIYPSNRFHYRISLNGANGANFQLATPGSSFPTQLIANDGTCYFMSSYTTSPGNQKRSWLLKTDSAGSKLWERDSPGSTGGYFKDIVLSQKTNLVLSAYCKQGTTLPAWPPLAQSGLYLIRMSLDGAVLETKLLLATEAELGGNICLAPDGSGYTLADYPGKLTFSNGNILPEDYSHPTTIFGFDPSGNLTWAQRLPSPREGQRHLIACDSQGVVICVNHDGVLDVAGFPSGSVNYGTLLVRWRKDGIQEWQRVIDDPDHYESVGGLAVDAAGNVVFGLMTETALNIDCTRLPINPGLNDENFSQAALIRLTRNGQLADAFRLPSTGRTTIDSVSMDPTGRVLYSGQIEFKQLPSAILQIGDLQIQQNFSGYGGFYSITTPLGPPLLVSRQGSELTCNWSDYLTGFGLESSPSPFGPWNPVSTTTTSFTLNTSSTAGQYFRLKEQTE